MVPADLSAGSYYVGARVDAAREVDELVEGGTAATSRRYSVTASAGPDLVAVAVSAGSRSANPGEILSVTRTIRNAGQGPSGPLTYALVLSSDETLDPADREIWRGNLASLDAGEESAAQVQVRLPGDLRPGTYTTRPGDSLEVERSLENLGGDAGAFGYTLVLSSDARIDSRDEVLYRYRYYQGLGAGQTRSGSVTVTIPSDVRPGHYYLGLRLDGDDEVAETNEANQDQVSSFAIRVDRGQEVLRFDPRRVYMNDGDTLRVDGRSYRLLGYDTPEKSSGAFNGNQEPHASRATEHGHQPPFEAPYRWRQSHQR